MVRYLFVFCLTAVGTTLSALPKNPLSYYVNQVHSKDPVLFWLYENKDGNLATLLKNTGSTLEQIIRCNEIKDPKDLKSRKYLFIPYDKNYLVWNRSRNKFELSSKQWRTKDNIYYFTRYNGIQIYEDSIVGGFLLSGYGYRRDPFSGKYSFHYGWDLACMKDTPVFLNFNASVKKTGYDRIKGRYVILTYQDSRMELHLYHLNRVLVRKGQMVRKGAVIALSGNTGKSSGAHLHLSVLKENKSVNPASWCYFVSGEQKYLYKISFIKDRVKKEVLQEI